MTNPEFSNQFDVLISSFTREIPTGMESGDLVFDEYEKSVFLTQAQEELILALYNGKNASGDIFEGTEEVRRYLSSLLRTYKTSKQDKVIRPTVSDNSYFFKIPEDVWFITYEAANIDRVNGRNIMITPITQDTYHYTKNNPFRGPSYNRILRLDSADNIVELVSKFSIKEYIVKYLAKPTPIILVTLTDDLSINGISDYSECSLHESLHNQILKLAVNKAIQSRSIVK